MPVKYRVKHFETGAYYHIYNRGVEGREIFLEPEDYGSFLKFLERYVVRDVSTEYSRYKSGKPSVLKRRKEMSLEGEVEVAAFCLLPDHFHLLVRQTAEKGITKLMRRLITTYVVYFNRKYKRMGPLFESIYRSVVVNGEEEGLRQRLVALVDDLHWHPVTKTARRFGPVLATAQTRPEDYLYTSFKHYIGENKFNWIKNNFIIENKKRFPKISSQPQKHEKNESGMMVFD